MDYRPEVINKLSELYAGGHDTFLKSSPEIFNRYRDQAFEEFLRLGIPDRKNEAYKYTNLEKSFGFQYQEYYSPMPADFREAEKFHCDEAFLRSLNSNLKTAPTAGTDLKVPNVMPFEVEKVFDSPLRPKADPEKPITAAIADFVRLEIHQGGRLVATMPVSIARPGLRGKGSWTILGAIPGPRLATRQELTSAPKVTAEPGVAVPAPDATPPGTSVTAEQILAAGPRNPVGVFWIDLAKANSTEPLPYGLHGTSIPSRMKTQESLGGLRLTNWDIARAVRMLPEGTPLVWK